MDVEAKVKEIIMDKLGVEESQITPTASFINDLGADSLDIVELVMGFESAFSVSVPDEDAEKMSTVGDAVKYLTERLS
ncbi:MAG: acyl carrier protein [Ignavibacteriaceae bacterium]|jgi:acyl carrier protein|nr:acyl carrier protein [Ignavibacteriaceae bacterium]